MVTLGVEINDLDLSLLRYFNSFVGVSPVFDYYVKSLTNWSLFRIGWLIWFFCWVWFAGTGDEDRRTILKGLAGVTVAVGLAFVSQRILAVHQRPTLAAEELGIRLPNNLDAFHWSVNSFPSDTAVLVFGLAAVVWCVSRRVGLVAFLWVTLTAALPRVYLAYHFPSDILAGAVLATAVVLMFQRSRVVGVVAEKCLVLEKAMPQLFYSLAFFFLFELAYMFADAQLVIHVAKGTPV